MNLNEALFFLAAALLAVIIAKFLVYNVANAQQWF